jgi:chemotaxis protein methyltransferase CheR
MKPRGQLFVGHSENFSEHRDLFEPAGKTAYRKAA